MRIFSLFLVHVLFLAPVLAEDHNASTGPKVRYTVGSQLPAASELEDPKLWEPTGCFPDYCVYVGKGPNKDRRVRHYHSDGTVTADTEVAELSGENLFDSPALAAPSKKKSKTKVKDRKGGVPNCVNATSKGQIGEMMANQKQEHAIILASNLKTCRPCKAFVPYLDAYLKEFPDTVIYKVDTSEYASNRSKFPEIDALVNTYASGQGWPGGAIFKRDANGEWPAPIAHGNEPNGNPALRSWIVNRLSPKARGAALAESDNIRRGVSSEVLKKWQASGCPHS